MNKLLDDLKRFFKEDGWAFSEIADFPALQLPFRGSSGEWLCYAQARQEQDLFVFYSVCPLRTPEAQRAAMSEFINRANYGLLVGNFEIDFADGEVRYKTSLGMDDIELTDVLIRPVVYTNVLTLEHYLPGIISVINGDKTPSEAVGFVEKTAVSNE